MLAEITLAKNKLFLIEEPENDLHPKALKALLELILESSASNQFVISTHSNTLIGPSKNFWVGDPFVLGGVKKFP